MPPNFITEMEKTLSHGDVCELMGVPSKVMHVFAKALNPEFVWEASKQNFKAANINLLGGFYTRIKAFSFTSSFKNAPAVKKDYGCRYYHSSVFKYILKL
jgi:ATP-dependent phosphoenolpyruvate carboxykinase